MNQKNKKNLTIIIFSVILPLFLLLSSYKLVLFLTPLTPTQENVFYFLEGKEELAVGFTELEASHLSDVKQVVHYVNYVFYILLLAVTVLITSYTKNKYFLFQLLNIAGKVTVLAMLFLGSLTLLFFDFVFALFHKIFFPQGNWLFPAGSIIIQTFPLEFFVQISRNIFLLALFLGTIFILSRHSYYYVLRHRN